MAGKKHQNKPSARSSRRPKLTYVPRGQGRDLRGRAEDDAQVGELTTKAPARPSADILGEQEPLLTVPEAAEKMGVVVTRVQHLLRQHDIIAVDRDGVAYLPQRYFAEDGHLNKFVPGVIKLLSDGAYSDVEILEFLFTEDESLPGRPIDALHGHLAREVMRRAQAMAL